MCSEQERKKARKAADLAKKAMCAQYGSVVYLGKSNVDVDDTDGSNSRLPKDKIITDVWALSTTEDYQQTAFKDLYLSPVPPALACQSEDEFFGGKNTSISFQDDAVQSFDRLMNECTNQANELSFWDSDLIKHAVRSLFVLTDSDRRKEVLHMLQQTVAHNSHHIIPLPRPDHSDMVGLVQKLDGGIGMIYITPPMVCFPEVTKAEMALPKGMPTRRQFTLLRSPVVAYRCLKEGWIIVRTTPLSHHHFSIEPNKGTHCLEKELIFLKIFMAAAEFGDLACLYGAWRPARKIAIFNRKEHLFIPAALRLLQQLIKIHPQPRREEAYFLYEIGELHENRAGWLIKHGESEQASQEEIYEAAKCHRLAALRTHQFIHSRGMKYLFYNALGVALIRMGEASMAKRSLLWAMTDPHGHNQEEKMHICSELTCCWNMLNLLEEDDMTQLQKNSLKQQRTDLRALWRNRQIEEDCFLFECTVCHKRLRLIHDGRQYTCGRCALPYCSKHCQEQDWKTHKFVCVRLKAKLSSKESYGVLCDTSREKLGALSPENTTFQMPLAEYFHT